ncbi:MAG: helix-turn-helix domain-containing protein [Clostridia bacterium]|nr:helix-turn-helix domain-containing protein [Clostridia bacterium]
MRIKDDFKKKIIVDYIDSYFDNYRESPSLRQIAEETGISLSTVHRYLQSLNDDGVLAYKGRRQIQTYRMDKEHSSYSMPVLGYVACGEGQEESEEIIEYIRLPESLIGKGEFFVLISKGESMIDAGIHPGDYVVINRSQKPNIGDIVVALYEGKNNLKVLKKTDDGKKYFLESCNSNKIEYPDIYVQDLKIQGVAISVIHSLKKVL